MYVSVVVTTRNRPVLLRRALASILRQSCPSFEVVVVDDGSLPEFAPEYDAIARELGPGDGSIVCRTARRAAGRAAPGTTPSGIAGESSSASWTMTTNGSTLSISAPPRARLPRVRNATST